MTERTLRHCEHGFDWRIKCPHGCTAVLTDYPYCEFEVHCQFDHGAVWHKCDSIDKAKEWMADPWKSFPGYDKEQDFGAVKMTLYRRIVEPWERLEEWTDHEGWHREGSEIGGGG